MNTVSPFAAALEAEISDAYRQSGNATGWRLLYSSAEVLKGADVAFIGLNPGGVASDDSDGEFALPHGSAYRDETWPSSSRLQEQVLALFERLQVAPEAVLAGNLVPFRSRSWSDLERRAEALMFGEDLWTRIFRHVAPSVVVTMGGEANHAVARILNVEDAETFPVGWGRIKATRGKFSGGTWIGLPHLSRFTIMTRPASTGAVSKLFDGVVCNDWPRQLRPFADIDHDISMLRSQSALPTFATPAKSGDGRIHSSRTKPPLAGVASTGA